EGCGGGGRRGWWRWRSWWLLEFGGEEVADGKAAVGPPALGDGVHLRFCWQMVEPVQPLNRVPEPKVTGEKHVGPVECEDQKPVRCRGPHAGRLGHRG